MNKNKKKYQEIIDFIIMCIFYCVFSPFVVLYSISYICFNASKYLFDRILNPIYNKTCKIIRRPVPNSSVYILGQEYKVWHRANDKLLTIKQAKLLGKEYEEKGYKINLSLSEL